MTVMIETANAVLLLVGREDFTPPRTFAGATCVATHDCVAVAVLTGQPTAVTLSPGSAPDSWAQLGEFVIEAEGLLSLRDVWNKEYDAAGVTPGMTRVGVWGNDRIEPSEIALQFTPA